MKIVVDLLAYVAIGSLLSWVFFYLRRKDLIGGFSGGMVVGILGAVLGVLVLKRPIDFIIDILREGLKISNVDIFAGLLGGYIALYTYNLINHDKTRKNY